MPAAITLKNVPDEIYEKLKAAAAAHHRSVNKEVIACLEQAYSPTKVGVEERLAQIRKFRGSLGPRKFKSRDILRAIDEGRP